MIIDTIESFLYYKYIMEQLKELAVRCPKCGHINLFGGDDIKTLLAIFNRLMAGEDVTESSLTCIQCKIDSTWAATLSASVDLLEKQFSN